MRRRWLAVLAVGATSLVGVALVRSCGTAPLWHLDSVPEEVPDVRLPEGGRQRLSASIERKPAPQVPVADPTPVEVQVTWLYTREAAAGVDLTIGSGTTAGPSRVVTTGPTGMLELADASELSRVRCVNSEHSVFVADATESEPARLLLGRHVLVKVTITASDREPGAAPPLTSAEVERLELLDAQPPSGPKLVTAVSEARISRAGISLRTRLGPFSASNCASARVVLVDKLAVRAWAPGYRPKMARISPSADSDTVEVHLHLERATRISGRVADETGQPLSGVRIAIASWVRGRPGEYRVADLIALQPAASFGVVEGATSMTVSVKAYATSGPDGTWTADLVFDGTIEVAAFAESRPTLLTAVSWAQIENVELRVAAAAETFVRLELDGNPIANARVTLSDVTTPAQIAAPYLHTDGDGVMSANFLLRGRDYALSVRGQTKADRRLRTRITWEGQEVVRF